MTQLKNLQVVMCSVLLLLVSGFQTAHCQDSLSLKANGISLYKRHCVVCHGNYGMGDGVLPLSQKDYPSTNLMVNLQPITPDGIVSKISGDEYHKELASKQMPIWLKDPAKNALKSLTFFINYLREEPDEARKALERSYKRNLEGVSANLGQDVFNARCVVCHGATGTGDGRMAKVIRTPPPANLALSKADDQYLKSIIEQGGKLMGRSDKMPPWKDELSTKEILSIIRYIRKLQSNK